jgi:phosphoribosylanthranilate isomerase
MKVKVCGMGDAQNILALQERIQPDWMGIICYPPSPRYVPTTAAAAIKATDLPKVGVFVNASLAEIQEKIEAFGLSVLQLHGEETVAEVAQIKQVTGLTVFKVLSVKEEMDWRELEGYLPYVDYFLFDTFTTQYGGSGKQFNWEVLIDYPFEKPFLLSGGIGLDNIHAVKLLVQRLPQLAGIDVNSKFEIRPGFKDIDMLASMKDLLEQQE